MGTHEGAKGKIQQERKPFFKGKKLLLISLRSTLLPYQKLGHGESGIKNLRFKTFFLFFLNNFSGQR